jgi:hypothetical protein
MKTILTLCFFLVSFLFYPQDSLVCGPHSGAMKKAGNYYVEMANCTDLFQVFVYSKNRKLIHNSILKGEVDFSYIDETFVTSPLFAGKCNDLTASIPAKGFYKCKVTIMVEKELVQAFFDNECLQIIAGKKKKNRKK